MNCPQCATPVPTEARFCPGCGASQSSLSQMPTMADSPVRPRPEFPASPIGRLDSSHASQSAAFAAGQVIGERYRIIGLLGRGGMGEVYRADDLTLGQPVSLKFLPRKLATNASLLERFRAEVRNARQVSHPNVCRVYDIGEIEGQPYLSMEFVDGEDLATLLRRIGLLPKAKATEVARQLCAGIAAAHDKGVLHRDLKPSNVMIDGNGRVRITDFGLAVRGDEAATGDISGTPAYMAPEQFRGEPATVQSDLYSLGLILYEIYTGHAPFEAASYGEWKSRHTRSEPTRPSLHGEPLDEATERAILRCLEKDPDKRPASALQLAAALPGGDPVAAALAAGETPSPEMVAASGGEGALSVRAASLLLALFLVSIAAVFVVSPWSTDLGLAPGTLSSSVLREHARQLLARFKLDEGAMDSDDWSDRDYNRLLYYTTHYPSTEWRRRLRDEGSVVTYNYRQSPQWLELHNWQGRVSWDTPAPILPGMASVRLRGDGALQFLKWIPPQIDSLGSAPAVAADWPALFSAAHLDPSRFRPVPSYWMPQSQFDTRAEWVGASPWMPGVELRVVAGSYRGKPTYFEVRGPWTKPLGTWRVMTASGVFIINLVFGLLLGLLFVCGLLAHRNLKVGRGDRVGASRFGLFVLACGFLGWAFRTHYFPDFTPMIWNTMNQGLGLPIVMALFAASVYLALEPYLRRRMPELLVGWARLLEGRFLDAQVGREILIGLSFGAVAGLLSHLTSGLPSLFPLAGESPVPVATGFMESGSRAVAEMFGGLQGAVGMALILFGILFLLRVLLRNLVAAVVVTILVATALSLGGENVGLELPGAIVTGALIGICMFRAGLLGLLALFLCKVTITSMPLPAAANAPYLVSTVVISLGLLGLALFAFRRSLGSQVQLGRGFAEELG